MTAGPGRFRQVETLVAGEPRVGDRSADAADGLRHRCGAASRVPSACGVGLTDVAADGVRTVFAFPSWIGAARPGLLAVFRPAVGKLTPDEVTRALTTAQVTVTTVPDRQHGRRPRHHLAGQPAGLTLNAYRGTKAAMTTTTVSPQRLARVFVEVADTLVADFDLIEFLQLLASRTADLLDASPVGLLLADPTGRLEFMAASDETVKHLELFQVQNQEGPCLDAFRTGAAVVNADLQDAADRWPLFAPRAVAAGLLSVHAFPLRLRSDCIGVMNVFSSHVGGHLPDTDVHIVQALADVASIALLQERAIKRGERLTEQLRGTLNSRIAIEQAKGALAHIHGITVDEAFIRIRAHARRTNQRLGDVAQAVLADPRAVVELFI
ncbi:GAF and ANTAR domain-containing protein [Catellatospora vulcania]|uniref:GAF and ANTAR domain-containing protein n=1 Tax=Catellatospora vulcania TaxID=1460450 RepID=UPI001E2A77E1|nr:GAF and ANTAR domain-containing protein [Catellatospora vulcania]